MKTDLQLHKDVIDELRWDPRVNEAEIGVSAKGGVVTLTGSVDTYAQKYVAERAVEKVTGVRAVADELNVRPTGAFLRNDTDIAHSAVNALAWDIEVPEDKITAKVDSGWITLKGEVNWNYQKIAAERAVRYLAGVKGISNLIEVKPKVSALVVKSKIEAALKRNAELDAKRITVEAADGKVTLKGNVRSWTERTDAEHAAWAAPGVKEVDDRLLVTPALV
jgi:osmotically-inducible protein OsmY